MTMAIELPAAPFRRRATPPQDAPVAFPPALPIPSSPKAPTPRPGPGNGGLTLSAWVGNAPKRKKGIPKVSPERVMRVREELRVAFAKGEFAGLGPAHLVALYAHCHAQVYGVEAVEMGPGRELFLATKRAESLIKQQFGGNVEMAVRFVGWTWQREKYRLAKRTGSDFRIGWRLQFSEATVTDYRVAMKRGE